MQSESFCSTQCVINPVCIFRVDSKSPQAKDGNTSRGTELKAGTYLYQPVAQISAPKIQELITTLHGCSFYIYTWGMIYLNLLTEARENPDFLKEELPPLPTSQRTPIGDVFTSCNWALRDG